MSQVIWANVFAHPWASLKIVALAGVLSVQGVIRRVLLPFASRPTSLGIELRRAWLAATFRYNGSLLYSVPPAGHSVQEISSSEFSSYVIPSTKPPELEGKDMVILFAHGGGMFLGHALQYLETYRRWVRKAMELVGKDIVVVSVDYPLSTIRKWPAQREAFLAQYKWLLDQGVPSSKIAFAGDSSGGNLVALCMLLIRNDSSLPQPACSILQPPYLDMTGSQTVDSPRRATDFLMDYNDLIDVLNSSLRPTGTPFDTPEISALLAKDVAGLPPQLVYWADTEVLGPDSQRWIQRCREAGLEVREHVGKGQLHTYALGWPMTGQRMTDECDALLLGFLLENIERTTRV